MNLQVWREARSSSSSPLQYSGDNFAKWVIKMRKKLKKKGQEHHSGGGEDAAEVSSPSEMHAFFKLMYRGLLYSAQSTFKKDPCRAMQNSLCYIYSAV